MPPPAPDTATNSKSTGRVRNKRAQEEGRKHGLKYALLFQYQLAWIHREVIMDATNPIIIHICEALSNCLKSKLKIPCLDVKCGERFIFDSCCC